MTFHSQEGNFKIRPALNSSLDLRRYKWLENLETKKQQKIDFLKSRKLFFELNLKSRI